jgi:hypothetical protein
MAVLAKTSSNLLLKSVSQSEVDSPEQLSMEAGGTILKSYYQAKSKTWGMLQPYV